MGKKKDESPKAVTPITRAALVAVVMSKIGAPYAEQGRRREIGFDCIGLMTSTGIETGIHSFDPLGYSNQPDGQEFERLLDKNLERLGDWKGLELLPADLLAIDQGKGIQHVVMITGRTKDGRFYMVVDTTRRHGVAHFPFRHPITKAKRIIAYRVPGLIEEEKK